MYHKHKKYSCKMKPWKKFASCKSDWKKEYISPEEGVYMTGTMTVYHWKKIVYYWRRDCISLEKGVFRTGKTTVYYWKKKVCFKSNYSTIQTRSFHFSFK